MTFLMQSKAKIAVLIGALSIGVLIGAPALADNHTGQPDSSDMEQDSSSPEASSVGTIVDVASGSESFNTLVQAVQAAGLVDTLAGSGPYTVFAPTDEAFNQLPDGALEYLLQPENQDLLRQVLTYHVVPGEVTSSQISTGAIESLSGGLAVRITDDNRVIVNNASVINADIETSNGVIHAVNRVLLPNTLQAALASQLGVDSIY